MINSGTINNNVSIAKFNTTINSIDLQKMDRNILNATSAGKTNILSLLKISNTYVNVTFGASGAEYTAPANGFYVFNKGTGASDKYMNIQVGGILVKNHISQGNENYIDYVFVGKGQKLKLDFNMTGTSNLLRFYYAAGEVNT